MATLRSQITPKSQHHSANVSAHQEMIRPLTEAVRIATNSGGEKTHSQLLARGLLARVKIAPLERVSRLLDAGSPFPKVGISAAKDLYDGVAPGVGVMAGVGRACGREVMIVCNDVAVIRVGE